jgi:secretion/DNA translocation related TadE-like protein
VKDERGSATLLALFIIPVLCAGTFLMLALAQQAIVKQELRTAADLSALAAAQALGMNCERASDIAQAHGAAMEACLSEGADWTITVSLPSAPLMQRLAGIFGHEMPNQREHATAGYSAVTGAPSKST